MSRQQQPHHKQRAQQSNGDIDTATTKTSLIARPVIARLVLLALTVFAIGNFQNGNLILHPQLVEPETALADVFQTMRVNKSGNS